MRLKVGRIENDDFTEIPNGNKIATGEKIRVELSTIETTDFK